MDFLKQSIRPYMKSNYLLWALFALFAIGVGLYPLTYFLADMSSQGILASKSQELLASSFWNLCFYGHVSLGGIALLSGWSQFFKNIRNRYLKLHRILGMVYVLAVLISGLSSLYIAYHTEGGITAILGFEALGMLWLLTTFKAYQSVKAKNLDAHENWMIRSYALTFAAVALRIWLPLFTEAFQILFIEAYRVVAWLCWVPNLLIAEMIIRKKYVRKKTVSLVK